MDGWIIRLLSSGWMDNGWINGQKHRWVDVGLEDNA